MRVAYVYTTIVCLLVHNAEKFDGELIYGEK